MIEEIIFVFVPYGSNPSEYLEIIKGFALGPSDTARVVPAHCSVAIATHDKAALLSALRDYGFDEEDFT